MLRSRQPRAVHAGASTRLCLSAGHAVRSAGAAALALAGATPIALAQSPPTRPALFDPFAVTAARGSQPIADVLADITVIGPAEIARAGAQSLTELLQRQPGVEIVQNGGPGAVSGVFLRGANRGQTLVLIDGVRDRLVERRVRRRSRRSRSTRSSGSRSCADRRRASTAPTPSAASSRCSRGAGPARSPATRARVTAPTAPGTSKGGVSRHDGAGAIRGAGGGQSAATASTRSPTRRISSSTPTRTGTATRACRRAPDSPRRRGQEFTAQFFRSRLDNQFDGGPDFDDRTITVAETWQVASRNRLAPFWVSRLSAGAGIDDSQTQTAFGHFSFKTTQRQYAWQNEFALPLGALTAGFERREERVATDAGFAMTAAQHEFAVRHLPAARRRITRCRRTCATTIRASTAARPPAPSPTAIASRRRCGPPRGTAPASRRRRSTTSTTRASPIPTSCPRRRGTSKPALLERRYRRGEPRSARHRLPQPRVAAHRLSMRRGLQLRPAQRRPRDARGRDARPRGARRQRRDASRLRSTSSRRRTTARASSCRGGRAGTAR